MKERLAPQYMYAAAELVDRAADLLAEGAVLVHGSERPWRVFHDRVQTLKQAAEQAPRAPQPAEKGASQ